MLSWLIPLPALSQIRLLARLGCQQMYSGHNLTRRLQDEPKYIPGRNYISALY